MDAEFTTKDAKNIPRLCTYVVVKEVFGIHPSVSGSNRGSQTTDWRRMLYFSAMFNDSEKLFFFCMSTRFSVFHSRARLFSTRLNNL